MSIVCVGVDLAKNVFAVRGIEEHGKPALVRPAVARTKPVCSKRFPAGLGPGPIQLGRQVPVGVHH